MKYLSVTLLVCVLCCGCQNKEATKQAIKEAIKEDREEQYKNSLLGRISSMTDEEKARAADPAYDPPDPNYKGK